ncbi:hypothetical protein RRG08_049755 [Elysia crispata]|uniref:Uncharacterized protein n=1 Tax=Elysia crispata TaxID=231223 RepID=A0AAE0ZDQ3_9GAST|nr:hypothetical protein RRG08_049755 [Elysia crispata]
MAGEPTVSVMARDQSSDSHQTYRSPEPHKLAFGTPRESNPLGYCDLAITFPPETVPGDKDDLAIKIACLLPTKLILFVNWLL